MRKAAGLMVCVMVVLGCSGGDRSRRQTVSPSDDTTPPAERGMTSEQMEEIQRVERVGRNAIVACYTDELERRETKKLKGKVVVKIHIGTAGSATQVQIGETTLNAPMVHECIKNVIRSWEFPRLRSAAWYGTTFFFSPAY